MSIQNCDSLRSVLKELGLQADGDEDTNKNSSSNRRSASDSLGRLKPNESRRAAGTGSPESPCGEAMSREHTADFFATLGAAASSGQSDSSQLPPQPAQPHQQQQEVFSSFTVTSSDPAAASPAGFVPGGGGSLQVEHKATTFTFTDPSMAQAYFSSMRQQSNGEAFFATGGSVDGGSATPAQMLDRHFSGSQQNPATTAIAAARRQQLRSGATPMERAMSSGGQALQTYNTEEVNERMRIAGCRRYPIHFNPAPPSGGPPGSSAISGSTTASLNNAAATEGEHLLPALLSNLRQNVAQTTRLLPVAQQQQLASQISEQGQHRVLHLTACSAPGLAEVDPLSQTLELFVGQLPYHFDLLSVVVLMNRIVASIFTPKDADQEELAQVSQVNVVTRIKQGPKPTCAFVEVVQPYAKILLRQSKRILCDQDGIWVATPQIIVRNSSSSGGGGGGGGADGSSSPRVFPALFSDLLRPLTSSNHPADEKTFLKESSAYDVACLENVGFQKFEINTSAVQALDDATHERTKCQVKGIPHQAVVMEPATVRGSRQQHMANVRRGQQHQMQQQQIAQQQQQMMQQQHMMAMTMMHQHHDFEQQQQQHHPQPFHQSGRNTPPHFQQADTAADTTTGSFNSHQYIDSMVEIATGTTTKSDEPSQRRRAPAGAGFTVSSSSGGGTPPVPPAMHVSPYHAFPTASDGEEFPVGVGGSLPQGSSPSPLKAAIDKSKHELLIAAGGDPDSATFGWQELMSAENLSKLLLSSAKQPAPSQPMSTCPCGHTHIVSTLTTSEACKLCARSLPKGSIVRRCPSCPDQIICALCVSTISIPAAGLLGSRHRHHNPSNNAGSPAKRAAFVQSGRRPAGYHSSGGSFAPPQNASSRGAGDNTFFSAPSFSNDMMSISGSGGAASGSSLFNLHTDSEYSQAQHQQMMFAATSSGGAGGGGSVVGVGAASSSGIGTPLNPNDSFSTTGTPGAFAPTSGTLWE